MKDRNKQRENRKKHTPAARPERFNNDGYRDPTANQAIANVMREWKKKNG